MNPEEIKQLLERYYEGISTPEEELLLKEYFNQSGIPEDFKTEKEIFRYYARTSGNQEPSEGFEDRIRTALDSCEEIMAAIKRRRIYGVLTGVAAGLLLLAGSYFLLNKRTEPGDTFSDPRLAYAETMKILYNVSIRLNDGTGGLEPVGKIDSFTEKSLETLSKPAGILEGKMKALHKFRNTINALEVINGEKTKK